MHRET